MGEGAISKKAERLAEDYLQAQKTSLRPGSGLERSDKYPMGPQRCHGCEQVGLRDGVFNKGCLTCGRRITKNQLQGQDRKVQDLRCFNCGRKGHVAMRCPDRVLLCVNGSRGRWSRRVCLEGQGVSRKGVVEGCCVSDIVLDTGCSQMLVRQDLVPPEEKVLEGEVVTIRCAHEDEVFSLAEVDVEVDGKLSGVEAAVSVLLGTNAPELAGLLNGVAGERVKQPEDVLVVMTLAGAKRQQ